MAGVYRTADDHRKDNEDYDQVTPGVHLRLASFAAAWTEKRSAKELGTKGVFSP
jgi:hypothetical protein